MNERNRSGEGEKWMDWDILEVEGIEFGERVVLMVEGRGGFKMCLGWGGGSGWMVLLFFVIGSRRGGGGGKVFWGKMRSLGWMCWVLDVCMVFKWIVLIYGMMFRLGEMWLFGYVDLGFVLGVNFMYGEWSLVFRKFCIRVSCYLWLL